MINAMTDREIRDQLTRYMMCDPGPNWTVSSSRTCAGYVERAKEAADKLGLQLTIRPGSVRFSRLTAITADTDIDALFARFA